MALLGVTSGTPALVGSSAACSAHGRAALTTWTQGKDDQVGKDFSAETAKPLPPAKLKQAWSALQQQAGSFKSLGNLQPRTLQGHDVLVAPMTFNKLAAAALVACDGSDHLIGLRVVPAAAAATWVKETADCVAIQVGITVAARQARANKKFGLTPSVSHSGVDLRVARHASAAAVAWRNWRIGYTWAFPNLVLSHV